MAGILFTITLFAILGAVGFLFAWMVRLASNPSQGDQQGQLQVAPVKDSSRQSKLPY